LLDNGMSYCHKGAVKVTEDADGFAFVMNVSSLDATSYELAPKFMLRRGTDEEVERIREMLARINVDGVPGFGFEGAPWERKLHEGADWKLLPKQDWRYFVISFEGSNKTIEDLGLSWCLASTELEVGFTLFWTAPGSNAMVCHPDRLFQMRSLAKYGGFFRNVTRADIEETKAIMSQLELGDAQIQNLARQLQGLKGLPHDSSLRFLGYFALLESVLTHSPKPEDRYDSITRQVQKKLSLLNSRWARKIDYGPFAGATHEKIWSKMYEYRSKIAHGGTADFSNDLKVLKGVSEALTLIRETVKSVLRHALLEPQLLRDLREC